jgi:hypothetical protein
MSERIEELLRVLGIRDHGLLRLLREEGLFEAEELSDLEADELRVALCLMQDLGVNAAGVEVVLRMRRRLLVLQERAEEALRALLEERR